MRPLRLQMAGFTSFREEATVEFEGADHFVLMGPTGAGKSSVIDAMTFALYGSVPRYENRNLVAPVITQGRNEARVRLDFSVDGKEYTAVRVVRRSGRGATTKEARLEAAGEVIAGTADELTEAVTDLIGLSFEHFCKCVVLPQGEFSRFLHDKPADRQDMLIRLLNLGIYESMRHKASARAARDKTKIEMLNERITSEADDASPERLAAAEERHEKLAALRTTVSDSLPRLTELSSVAEQARKEAAELESWVARLTELSVPDDLTDLGTEVAEAQSALAEAKGSFEAASQAHDGAATTLEKLADKDTLVAVARKIEELGGLNDDVTALADEVAAAEDALAAAQEKSDAAEQVATDAEAALAEIELDHTAHALAAELVKGEPCPVCNQVVSTIPKRTKPAALRKAETALEKANDAWDKELAKTDAADKALVAKKAEADALDKRVAALKADLKGAPTAAKIEKQLAEIAKAEAAAKDARAAEAEARKALDAASQALEKLRTAERDGRKVFERTRDSLAALEPPGATHDSLAADWTALVGWAAEQVPVLTERAAAATSTSTVKTKELEAAMAELVEACVECDLEIDDPARLAETVVEAATNAAAEVTAIRKAIESLAAARKQLEELQRDHALASGLAQHLSAKGFERWIVNEALRRLVEGATVILKELSNDQYSLTVDDSGAFLVTDHHNANETRSARTLSGGETFLASLALALALSDQLVELAAEGSARLEAIFLDEGFGTLDPETLDTVAATVENLAAGGRMVGIITHVRDLAERVPLQFRVRKQHGASTVERVVA